MKKIIAGLLFLLMLLCAGCSSSELPTASDASGDTLTQTQSNYQAAMDNLEKVLEQKKEIFGQTDASQEESQQENEYIEYIEVTAQQIFDDLAANPVKAELTYLDKYIAVTGLLDNSVTDHTFSIVSDINLFNQIYDNGGSIICTVDSSDKDYYRDFPKDNSHKEITVWGKVTSIDGETFIHMDAIKYELAPELELEDIEFAEVTTDDLMDAYDISPSVAQQEYLNKYIVFKGEIYSITSDYLIIENPCVTTSRGGRVHCYYTSDEIKAIVAEKSEGDSIVVSGRVTDMQDFLWVIYDVDVLILE